MAERIKTTGCSRPFQEMVKGIMEKCRAANRRKNEANLTYSEYKPQVLGNYIRVR